MFTDGFKICNNTRDVEGKIFEMENILCYPLRLMECKKGFQNFGSSPLRKVKVSGLKIVGPVFNPISPAE